MATLHVLDLGRVGYTDALELQRRAAALRIAGTLPSDLLILCEHPPVVTLGRARSSAGHLLVSEAELNARGAELHEVERGGDVTFHGPGQLVGYAIVDLKQHRKDLHWFLRQTEEALIRTSATFGVVAERVPGLTGVWVHGRKLASIGVHARDWVTWHGFALNVSTELEWFSTMVPCGIADVRMTSLADELAPREPLDSVADASSPPSLADAAPRAASAFADVFELLPQALPDELVVLLTA
jgi:lipoyl(octanoyl) transferase